MESLLRTTVYRGKIAKNESSVESLLRMSIFRGYIAKDDSVVWNHC